MKNNLFKIAISEPHQLDGIVTFDDTDPAAIREAWADVTKLRTILDEDEPLGPGAQRVIAVLRKPPADGPWSWCPEILPSF